MSTAEAALGSSGGAADPATTGALTSPHAAAHTFKELLRAADRRLYEQRGISLM